MHNKRLKMMRKFAERRGDPTPLVRPWSMIDIDGSFEVLADGSPEWKAFAAACETGKMNFARHLGVHLSGNFVTSKIEVRPYFMDGPGVARVYFKLVY